MAVTHANRLGPAIASVPTEAELHRALDRSLHLGVREEFVADLRVRLNRCAAVSIDQSVRRKRLVDAVARHYRRATDLRDPQWREARGLYDLWCVFRRWHLACSGMPRVRRTTIGFVVDNSVRTAEVIVERTLVGSVHVHLLGGSIGADGKNRSAAFEAFRRRVVELVSLATKCEAEGTALSDVDRDDWKLLQQGRASG